MEQPKVFEFAKEIGMETLALMDKIREWKLPVKSHMAPLDEQLINEIRNRLQNEAAARAEQAAKGKKRVVKKKADDATTAKAPSAAEAKATPVKSASAGEPATTKKAAAPAKKTSAAKAVKADGSAAKKAAGSATGKKTVAAKKPSIIRRKAGEAEARAQEEAAAALAAEAARAELEEAGSEASGEAGTHTPSSGQEAGEVQMAGSAAPTAEEPKKGRNIIGRMDLRRVSSPSSPGSSSGGFGTSAGTGAAGSAAAGQPRALRSAPRNMRTGFFSAPTSDEQGFDTFEERAAKEEAKAKKRPAAQREEEEKVFAATEFRKREVIFQPKKKRPLVGRDAKQTLITTPKAHKRVVKVNGTIKLGDLAQELGIKGGALVKRLMGENIVATMTTDLDFDTVALLVPEYGWDAQNVKKSVEEILQQTAVGELDAEKVTRPPVVTVMGHVDHGKTSLLDTIRKARVAAGEAGGITQHIGAYSVQLDGGKQITFIDTPGHEAFTAMRARGANVTDIAIIVVAADDGVMPQTVEAINHARAANVPIIVAVNKIDKPGINIDRIKQALTEYQLVPEEWGGTTIYCPVSALRGDGIPELLEQIQLVAEIQELKANPKRSGTGVVIESRMEKGRGPVATLLVQDGTVSVGQNIVAGTAEGKVRSLTNDRGESVPSIGPGLPVEVLGLSEPPKAGDRFDIVVDEEAARRVANERHLAQAQAEVPSAKMSLEQLFAKVKSGDVKELALVLKSDVAGSLEAIKGQLEKVATAEVKVKVIHAAVGGITESDVLLASTAQGLIIGFNVRPDGGASRLAKEKNIEIKTYSIIYELIDDIKKAMVGLLAPQFVEKSHGRAEVRNTFVVPKVGTIAGCAVVDGKIARGHQVRLVRDGKIIYEGKLGSLKRFKDDVREVASGYECGIGIENFNDIKTGDIIESFVKEQVAREL